MTNTPASTRLALAVSAATLLLAVPSAHAYVGPGLGAGTLAVIGGVIGSIVLAIFAIVWYPLKRMLKSKKKQRQSAAAERSDDDAESGDDNRAS